MGKKILVSGPESSGKTSLCHFLATRLNGLVRSERARTYLMEAGADYRYTAEDLKEIWRLQCQEEAMMTLENDVVICDTAHFVMAVWNEVKFSAPELCLSELRKPQPLDYDYVLLCAPDIDWEPDPLREAPDQRLRLALFERYEYLIKEASLPYSVIRGQEERGQGAINALASFGIKSA